MVRYNAILKCYAFLLPKATAKSVQWYNRIKASRRICIRKPYTYLKVVSVLPCLIYFIYPSLHQIEEEFYAVSVAILYRYALALRSSIVRLIFIEYINFLIDIRYAKIN